ncbi:paraflagellar rod component [Trypanosoma rangeli]|uniref:Paraflagellar rod component n=1 Tax=Trypanosoma rangeli TaxID=5698 RepID=A0A3R7P0W8_TRYRA|nr:paraflagellar rod component [Trypanosoma rangeli]RNF10888.1 paraflagellar rod component [Trypanosoma rangeli]|eukprot:RNF10888.1 paraflagellar rod component [Trypanosoma rangeli]
MDYKESFDLVLPQYPRRGVQEAENHRSVAALYELVENAISTAENYVAYTQGRLVALSARGSDLMAAATEMKERYKHEAPCGWTEEKLMQHCKQEVTAKEMSDIISRPPLDVAGIRSILLTLQEAKTELPRGRFLLMRDNLSALKPHQPSDLTRDVADICGALYEIRHVDLMAELRRELSELDKERQKAQKKLDEAIRVHESTLAKGDVVEVERAHRQLIAARYELVDACAKLMREIVGDDMSTQENSFASEMDALQRDAEEVIGRFKDALHDRRQALRDDLRNCDQKRIEEDGNHQKSTEAYNTKEKEMDAQLGQIVQQKQKLVEELRQKARELQELMLKQKEMVETQVKAKRAEEERVTAYNEFVSMEEQQKHRLLRCLDYFDRIEPVIPELQSYVDEMIVRMPRQSLRQTLNQLNDTEAEAFMDAYGKFVSCCGELTVKKMHRLDTLERQARLVEHNRNSAMESLDPNMSNYRVELEDLIEQMKGVSGVINALNATQDAGEQLFQSVEEGVLAKYGRAGTPFVHPLQEYGIRSVEERGRFVDRSMRYVEDEERKVLEKKNVLNRMRQAVEEEEAATESALRKPSAAAEY